MWFGRKAQPLPLLCWFLTMYLKFHVSGASHRPISLGAQSSGSLRKASLQHLIS